MNKRKFVKVTLEIPKEIIDYHKSVVGVDNLEKVLVEKIVDITEADVDNLFSIQKNSEDIVKRHSLRQVFERYKTRCDV